MVYPGVWFGGVNHQDADKNVDVGGFPDESFIRKGKAPPEALDDRILRTIGIVDADRVLKIIGILEVVRLFGLSPDL